MTRAERAKELFESGYNCSQSIIGAFSDLIDIDEKKLVKMVSGLGGGVGRMRGTCGAITGITIVLSYLEGYDEPDDEKKKELYSKIQALCKEFMETHKSINCAEMLKDLSVTNTPTPDKRTPEYYKKRPCGKTIYDAAFVLEKYLQHKKQ